jgi:hypothetical protein
MHFFIFWPLVDLHPPGGVVTVYQNQKNLDPNLFWYGESEFEVKIHNSKMTYHNSGDFYRKPQLIYDSSFEIAIMLS